MARPKRGEIDPDRFDVLTFDCNGTIIDWETGILAALRAAHAGGRPASDEELLERFATHEAAADRGDYRLYRDVLAQTLRGIGNDFGVDVTDDAARRFADSVGDWPAFPD